MRKITHDSVYNGHGLSDSNKNNEGFYVEILQRIKDVMECMIRRHGKVFFVILVLRFPSGQNVTHMHDNSFISNFIESLKRYYERHACDPAYLWVRENSYETGQIHYHVMLLLNGDKIQNAYGILDKATKLWQHQLGIDDGRGLVELCKWDNDDDRYGGVKIRRNDPNFQQVVGKCFERASYLAKRFSKGGAHRFVNGFRSSRIP